MILCSTLSPLAEERLLYQFAATACTIVSGAIAERTKFEAYILYSFFMAAWVYPILTHSVWSTAGWAGMFRSVSCAHCHTIPAFATTALQAFVSQLTFSMNGALCFPATQDVVSGAAKVCRGNIPF